MSDNADATERLARERNHMHDALNRIAEWTMQHGAALRPDAGSADTFGDGMRAAKRQVLALIRSRDARDAHAARAELIATQIAAWHGAHCACPGAQSWHGGGSLGPVGRAGGILHCDGCGAAQEVAT